MQKAKIPVVCSGWLQNEAFRKEGVIIAISHREKFTTRATCNPTPAPTSLVGVAREVEEQTSVSLTLDLPHDVWQQSTQE